MLLVSTNHSTALKQLKRRGIVIDRNSYRDRYNNCDMTIQYIQEHYFHYDAKRATDALATGRGQLKGATGSDWMRDPYGHDS